MPVGADADGAAPRVEATPPAPGAPPLPDVVAPPDVPLLRWPAEADRRAHLATAGRPRLLVLEADVPPPLVWDDLEDWVRTPADPVEVQSRLATLAERAAAASTPSPVVDADGIVRWRGEWVAVPPVEARLLASLAERRDEVVRRSDLVAAAWPAGLTSDRTLDGRIKHLRRRIAPLGLVIRTVRGVGFLLEDADGASG